MKKIIFTLLLIYGTNLYAQKNKDPETFIVSTGGTFGKSKVVPSTEKLGIGQISIYFKNTTKRSVYSNQKSFSGVGKTVDAAMVGEITAYLITSDGDLTAEDYQEVADSFYTYLSKKLNENNIPAIGWNTITATDFYKNEAEEENKVLSEEMKNKGQVWIPVNANKGATIWNYNPFGGISPGFAFGKIKKTAKFCKDLDASAVFMHLTVDFADIILEGEVNSRKSKTAYTETTINKYKLKSEVAPNVKITPKTENSSYFWNEKMQNEIMTLQKEISSETEYANSTENDPKKIEEKSTFKKLFGGIGFSKKITAVPVVIETTRAQYKTAAKKALENYANAMVEYIKSSKSAK